MTNEKLCLKWNDFQNLAQASFGDLRADNDFTDVTLACEDQSIKAHKVVLSACSPFFKKLLKTCQHPQPLIYLKGMKARSLTAIIDFLYLGEANVYQEELEDFLAQAEELQLQGLDGKSEKEIPEYPSQTFKITERVDVNKKQNAPKKQMSSYAQFENEHVGAMMMPYEQKPKTASIIEPATMEKIEAMMEKQVDGYHCTRCGYTSKNPGHLREHVEKHIEGLEYPCNICNRILRSSHSFREHIRRLCPSLKSSSK